MKYIIVFIFALSTSVFSQELNCKIVVNYEGLAVNSRELLVDFANEVERYMNTNQFTSEAWEGLKIDCTFNIFFTAGNESGEYSAQVVVVSTRPVYKSQKQSPILTINDGSWSFKYLKGQAMYANQTSFDPLTSFLDFYANVIIGFDWETWKDLGGNPYFKKAFDIVNLANNSSYKKGWERSSSAYSRWGLCDDLMNDKYRPFREAYFEYHYGVDEYQVNKKAAQDKIAKLVNVLSDMKAKMDLNSVLIRQFFDSKNGEIVELLRDYKSPDIFAKLKKLDPSHASKYDELLR